MDDYAMFEVGKVYCPSRGCCSEKGVYTITITKRTKTLVHFTVRLAVSEDSPVTTTTAKARILPSYDSEHIRFVIGNCPFGCESCYADSTPESCFRDTLEALRKWCPNESEDDLVASALRIAKKWYEYEP